MSESPRVLIVEDAADGHGRLASTLADAGFATRLAADGETALEVLDGWQPSAIIVDLRAQYQAGRQFCAALARRADAQDRPVVLVGEVPVLMKRLPVVPSGLVPTPFEDELLIVTVRRVTAEVTV
jgi:DNA-binding response OmpR family regulator